MKLYYRGVSYESNPQIIETVETGVTAMFRGQTYQVRCSLVKAYSQPQMNLKYRGVAYTLNPTPAINPQLSLKDDRIPILN